MPRRRSSSTPRTKPDTTRLSPALAIALSLVAIPAAAQEPPPPPTEEPAPPPPPPAPLARPSIVIDAKDDLGHDVRNVTEFIDDKPIAYELTGTSIELSPGPHTIALQRNDGPRQRATATITLGEGDANHAVHLAFEKPAEPETVESGATPLAPRIVAGVGIAGVVTGVVLLLARPALPTNCNSDTYKCTKLPAETEAKFAEERDTAGTNQGLLHAGVVTLLAGAGVTAAGVLWYVLEKPKPRTATIVAPWISAGSGGLALRASF
jgi:hypothetical protein